MKGFVGTSVVVAVAAVAAGYWHLKPHLEEVLTFLRNPRSLAADGSALNPEPYRAILLNNSALLEALGSQNATWREAVERGTTAAFQDVLRDMKRASDASSAFARRADGSAVDAAAFQAAWRADADRMAALEASDPSMHWVVAGNDDLEVFQDMLRGEAARERAEAKFAGADVVATMTVLDEDGVEKELHQVAPHQTEEELGAAALPARMRCAACGGVARQLELAVARSAPRRRRPFFFFRRPRTARPRAGSSATATRARRRAPPRSASRSARSSSTASRAASARTGRSGPPRTASSRASTARTSSSARASSARPAFPFPAPAGGRRRRQVQDDQFDPADALLQTHHGGKWDGRLADFCAEILVDHDELELAHAVARGEALAPVLCDVAGRCKPRAAPRKAKKKRAART